MKQARIVTTPLLILSPCLSVTNAWAKPAKKQREPKLVGHVTLVEGDLLGLVPGSQDGVALVRHAPFGVDQFFPDIWSPAFAGMTFLAVA